MSRIDAPVSERRSLFYREENGRTTVIEYLKTWAELKTDRRAVTALEYALIAGVIVATILAGFSTLAGDIADKFNTIGAKVTNPTPAP